MKIFKLLTVLLVIFSALIFFITRNYSINSIITSFFRNIYQKVDIIDIQGNETIPTQDIVNALYKVNSKDKMLLKNKKEIIESLKAFPLIDSVGIKYTLPSKLLITINERKPLFFYYTQNQMPTIVDTNFKEFSTQNISLKNLIFIRGKYQKEDIEKFLKFLYQYPLIYENITEIEMFFGYRFNIVLNNHLQVLLPEKNVDKSLKMLIKFIRKYNVLNSNIYRIDFRNDQKIFFASSKDHSKYKPDTDKFLVYKQQTQNAQYKEIIESAIKTVN